MKTVSEWLQEIPEPIRGKVIANMNLTWGDYTKVLDMKETHLSEFLLGYFNWLESVEGIYYWEEVYTAILEGEQFVELFHVEQ